MLLLRLQLQQLDLRVVNRGAIPQERNLVFFGLQSSGRSRSKTETVQKQGGFGFAPPNPPLADSSHFFRSEPRLQEIGGTQHTKLTGCGREISREREKARHSSVLNILCQCVPSLSGRRSSSGKLWQLKRGGSLV